MPSPPPPPAAPASGELPRNEIRTGSRPPSPTPAWACGPAFPPKRPRAAQAQLGADADDSFLDAAPAAVVSAAANDCSNNNYIIMNKNNTAAASLPSPRSLPALRPAATLAKHQATRPRLARARRAVWSQQDITLLADVHIAAALVCSAQQRAEGRAGDATTLHPCPCKNSSCDGMAQTPPQSPKLLPRPPQIYVDDQGGRHLESAGDGGDCRLSRISPHYTDIVGCSGSSTTQVLPQNHHHNFHHSQHNAGHLQALQVQPSPHVQSHGKDPCYQPRHSSSYLVHGQRPRGDTPVGTSNHRHGSSGTVSSQQSGPMPSSSSVSTQLSSQLVTLSI